MLQIYKKQTIYISCLAVLLWMVVIFILSAQPATQSNELSKGVTEIVLEAVERVAPRLDFDINGLNHLLRKNAHFFAYLILGILEVNAVKRSGICVLYAVSDEVHQLFVSGRSGQVIDVLIDSAGTVVGIGVYLLVDRIFERRKLKS